MSPKLILIRHAERPELPSNDVGYTMPLTENGLNSSWQFGQTLNSNVRLIHTSPLTRCIQTAEQIASANGYSIDNIKHSELLGDPGFFIDDGKLAWEHWKEKGHDRVNQFLLDGKESWTGFKNLNSATKHMKTKIRQYLGELKNNEIAVWVTHDTILAAFATQVLPQPLTLAQWPAFLGRLIITLQPDETLNFEYVQNIKQ